jgi:hypothetical protein
MDAAHARPSTIEQPLSSTEAAVVDGLGAPSVLGLGASPLATVSVLAAWAATGLLTAWVLSRRGHDGRVLGALGVVFGPLTIGLALDALRHGEKAVRPIVLDAGESRSGSVDVLVGLLGPGASVADALPSLSRMDADLGRLTVAAVIDFQSAENDDWRDAKGSAAAELQLASVFLADHRPALVLLAGRPERALSAFAADEAYDVVIVTGEGRDVATTHRRLLDDGRPTVLVAGGRRPIGR